MTAMVPRDGGVRLTAIVCQGVDPETEERCGKTYVGRGGKAWIVDQARAAGWKIGALNDGTPDAMCPACGKPDPATLAAARELKRSLS